MSGINKKDYRSDEVLKYVLCCALLSLVFCGAQHPVLVSGVFHCNLPNRTNTDTDTFKCKNYTPQNIMEPKVRTGGR